MSILGKSLAKKGKSFRDYLLQMREPIIEQCGGCARIDHEEPTLCQAYIYPEKAWIRGNCALATHIESETEAKKNAAKIRLGQQKQKKKTRK